MSPSNGTTVQASSETNFNVSKYGILSQFILSYTKSTYNGTNANIVTTITQNDVFNVIDRVQLYSGSSLISTLTKYDLMAQFSDMTSDELNTVQESCLKERPHLVTPTLTSTDDQFSIPLVFGFFDTVNTQLNTSFLEVLSVKVIWGTTLQPAPVPDITHSINSVRLVGRYKNYMNQDNTQILSENFGTNPSLNELSSRFYDENQSAVTTVVDGATGSLTVELKSTDVIEDFYLILMRTGRVFPEKIEHVQFIGSGDTIVDLSHSELQYMRLQENGNAISCSSTGGLNELTNVIKFQTGVYTDQTWSNGFSLREINAPLMTCVFKNETGGDADYYLKVVEKSSCVYEIISATGKLSLSLTN
jgi:hypothetical protein